MAPHGSSDRELGEVSGKLELLLKAVEDIQKDQKDIYTLCRDFSTCQAGLTTRINDHEKEHDKYMKGSIISGGISGGVLGSVAAGFLVVYEWLHGRSI
jgi:hypothetical protein